MITKKTLQLSLKSLRDFAKKRLPDEELIALDERDECPVEIVRHMSDPDKLGIQLLFIPEEYGGMGGSTMDVYLICEQMARIDLGVATSLFATFLGSDPITFGATPEQKKKWLGKIADEGILFAYGATEPDAGSDLGALKTTADRVEERRKDHRLQDQRQQAVDLERRHRRPLHHPGQHARRPNLVHRRRRHQGLRARQARGQARHSPEQHGSAGTNGRLTLLPTGSSAASKVRA